MGRFGIKVSFDKGFDELERKLGSAAAKRLDSALDVEMGVATRKMAMASARVTPVDTGALKASILHSPRRVGDKEYIYGSYLPYATRRNYSVEYNQATLNFMEKGFWHTKDALLKDVADLVERTVT